MKYIHKAALICALVFFLSASAVFAAHQGAPVWSESEKATLRSLWIKSLPELPVDPSNKYSDNAEAAELGEKFFFDPHFSKNGTVSCSTCHRADYQFTDDLPLAHGMGTTQRRSMPLSGVAYNTWYFWDGRADSLWAQALQPPEAPKEHGITRTRCAQIIDKFYRDEYTRVFGPIPQFNEQEYPAISKPSPDEPAAYAAWKAMAPEKRDAVNRVFVNMGKAIGAYVRLIMPGEARFDRYLEAVLLGNDEKAGGILSAKEAAGLRLFIGKAKCVNCHNGPLLTNGDFHNIGLPEVEGQPPDRGRAAGILSVFSNLFNCLSKYSDADPEMDCDELRYMDTDTAKYEGAFKTPTLRNVAERPPYMHNGRFATLKEVLEFYRKSPLPEVGVASLSDEEFEELEAFLPVLSGPVEVRKPR